MTTVVNNPAPSSDGGGSGMLIGALVFVAFIVFLFYVGLPAIRQMGQVGTPQINVPSKIDVTVQQPE